MIVDIYTIYRDVWLINIYMYYVYKRTTLVPPTLMADLKKRISTMCRSCGSKNKTSSSIRSSKSDFATLVMK